MVFLYVHITRQQVPMKKRRKILMSKKFLSLLLLSMPLFSAQDSSESDQETPEAVVQHAGEKRPCTTDDHAEEEAPASKRKTRVLIDHCPFCENHAVSDGLARHITDNHRDKFTKNEAGKCSCPIDQCTI